jgi:hypothetical protein
VTPVSDDIRELMDDYLSLSQSDENRRRLCLWEREVVARDQWHGRPPIGSLSGVGSVPLEIVIQYPFFRPLFEMDLAEVYQDPAAYVRFHLRRMACRFTGFRTRTRRSTSTHRHQCGRGRMLTACPRLTFGIPA